LEAKRGVHLVPVINSRRETSRKNWMASKSRTEMMPTVVRMEMELQKRRIALAMRSVRSFRHLRREGECSPAAAARWPLSPSDAEVVSRSSWRAFLSRCDPPTAF